MAVYQLLYILGPEAKGVAIMDEVLHRVGHAGATPTPASALLVKQVDLLLHPLKSELNFPVGPGAALCRAIVIYYDDGCAVWLQIRHLMGRPIVGTWWCDSCMLS